MASRGAVTRNGHVTTSECTEDHKVYDAKVLKGVGNNHSLPDYAHTKSSIYIKENTNGSFREMRIYDPDDGHVVLEIAYHPEPTLTGNRTTRILHYHRYDKDLKHGAAKVLTKLSDIYEKYKKYLEAYGL